jgi:hypothetical protein
MTEIHICRTIAHGHLALRSCFVGAGAVVVG